MNGRGARVRSSGMRVATNEGMRGVPLVLLSFVLVVLVAGATHADETSGGSDDARTKDTGPTLDVGILGGAGGYDTHASDRSSPHGPAAGIGALLFAPSGHGGGVRVAGTSDLAIFGGGSDVTYVDALYAFRPWPRRDRFAIVPTLFAGPSWMHVTEHASCFITCSGREGIRNSFGATLGATLDAKLTVLVVGADATTHLAMAGDDPLAVGWSLAVHLGVDLSL